MAHFYCYDITSNALSSGSLSELCNNTASLHCSKILKTGKEILKYGHVVLVNHLYQLYVNEYFEVVQNIY